MANFEYDQLTAAEQIGAIETRIQGLERDHFNVSLDVQTAGPNGNPPQQARLTEIEATITALRDRVKALREKS